MLNLPSSLSQALLHDGRLGDHITDALSASHCNAQLASLQARVDAHLAMEEKKVDNVGNIPISFGTCLLT